MAPATGWGRWLLPLILAACRSDLAAGVDKSKFRTCDQGSFCRRYRKYVKRIEGSSGAEIVHALDVSSLEHTEHTVSARLQFAQDAAVTPLKLELRFFKDAVAGRGGIVRMRITEAEPLHPRFELREGDVVVAESGLAPDAVKLSSGEGTTVLTSTAAEGGCTVTIHHRPFEVVLAAGGRTLQRVNGRHLLNFERYRDRAASPHAGLVDATDVDGEHLWEESFGGHKDTKPRGPAAVGLDVSFAAAHDLVGLAEHATNLGLANNKFSEPYRFFNLDVFEYALDVPMALYGAVPLVTAVHRWADGAAASGFFFCNPSEGFVKVDGPDSGFFGGSPDTRSWWVFESGIIDTFLFAGPTAAAVMQQYHTVTGWGRLPPLSTLGKHQSRWNYVDVDDSIGVNKKFDQHDIPYDVLWLDIEHTDGKKYFTWHPTHFAKPDELLGALEQSKRKLVTIVDPHIKRESGYDVFETIKKMDLFTKTSAGVQYDGWCWPGTSFYPDFCNPAMRDQWAKFFAMDYYPHNRPDLYTWNDMNEPSVFNGPEVTMPRDNLHRCHTEDYGVEHRDVHNVYGFYHHMATVQGQLERAPNVRPFVLTRSFFAGSHRHGAVWTGDNMARWDHMVRSVPMIVSLCLCGISFSGADVPGFFYDPDLELFKRWHQLGIWYPFYRGHAHLETKRREPWVHGDEVTSMIREQVTARYQLLPMWYTLFAEWSMAGLPVLRPLWFHDLADTKAFVHSDTHFLVGEQILVRAVTEKGAPSLNVYLPKGDWYDYWEPHAGVTVGGAESAVALHPGRVPVYVRRGTVLLKRMRRRRSSGAMAADPYSIFVYGPLSRGRVYIDDGSSHNYQQGDFLYEELIFDGSTLSEAPAPPLPAAAAPSQGAPGIPDTHLRVERVVLYGLASEPTGAALEWQGGAAEPGPPERLQISARKAGDGWTATIKKPPCLLGKRWAIRLAY